MLSTFIRFATCALIALLAGCAGTAQRTGGHSPATTPFALRVKQAPLTMPLPPSAEAPPARHSSALLAELPLLLYGQIGGFPPRYQNAQQRQHLHEVWSALLQEARVAARQEADAESVQFLLAELYRMGHNLGVTEAAETAQRQIHRCLQQYPDSLGCHFSAVRYYLSAAPLDLDAAEYSLNRLREYFGVEFQEEVERGFVFLSILRGDNEVAQRRISDYLAMFSDSPWATDLRELRTALSEGKVQQQVIK